MISRLVLTFLALAVSLKAKPAIDFSGDWRFALDPQDSGIASHMENGTLPDTIRLPGSMTSQGFGEAPSMKGYVSADEYRRFCGPVVPLIRTKAMVLTNDRTLVADVELSQFGAEDFKQLTTSWRLVTTGGETVAEGALPAMDLPTGNLHPLGRIEVPLSKVKAPAKLRLEVFSKPGGFANDWDFFVYPAEVSNKETTVLITRDLTEALSALGAGKKVLWCPPKSIQLPCKH